MLRDAPTCQLLLQQASDGKAASHMAMWGAVSSERLYNIEQQSAHAYINGALALHAGAQLLPTRTPAHLQLPTCHLAPTPNESGCWRGARLRAPSCLLAPPHKHQPCCSFYCFPEDLAHSAYTAHRTCICRPPAAFSLPAGAATPPRCLPPPTLALLLFAARGASTSMGRPASHAPCPPQFAPAVGASADRLAAAAASCCDSAIPAAAIVACGAGGGGGAAAAASAIAALLTNCACSRCCSSPRARSTSCCSSSGIVHARAHASSAVSSDGMCRGVMSREDVAEAAAGAGACCLAAPTPSTPACTNSGACVRAI